MNFDFSSAVAAKSSGNFLAPGIHKAKFVKVAKTSLHTKAGDDLDVMALTVDIDGYGEYTQNFFKPDPSVGRSDSTFGGQNPAPMEQFFVTIREILEALNPNYEEDLTNGTLAIKGTFAQIVNAVAKYTADYAGTEVEVKLLPQSNGFASMPSFPAKVNSAGKLAIQTYFIGHNLTLSNSEKKKIDAAAAARPTNMTSKADNSDLLSDMAKDLGIATEEAVDDLPF